MSILTSCQQNDNPFSDEVDPAAKALAELRNSLAGVWVDTNMDDQLGLSRVYFFDEDGQCDVYEIEYNNVSYNDEGEPSGESVVVSQAKGSWQVTADPGLLSDINARAWSADMTMLGTVNMNTKDVYDDSDEYVSILMDRKGQYEDTETAYIFRENASGELFFILRYDFELLSMLYDAGEVSDMSAAARAVTRSDDQPDRWEVRHRIEALTKDVADDVNTLKRYAGDQTYLHNDWMGYLYKGLNPRICDMSIPGAHDAFTGYMSALHPMSLWTKTQTKTIEEMWACGVRYFDARVRVKDGHLQLYHTFNLSISFKEVLQKLKALLDAHPTEMAILIVNFDDGNDPKMVYDELQTVKDYLVVSPKPGIRLNECRKKILVINRYGYSPDGEYAVGPNFRPAWADNTTGSEGEVLFAGNQKATLLLQDLYHYENSIDINDTDVKKDNMKWVFDKARFTCSTGSSTWVINHESAYCFGAFGYWTSEFADMNYSENSHYLNPYVADHLLNNRGSKTGIVVFDYVGMNDDSDGAKSFGYNPDCVYAPRYLVMNNLYMVKKHTISLSEDDIKYW